MVKVIVSQIPEESGKPKIQKKMKTMTKKAKDFDDEEDDRLDDTDEEEDEPEFGITINKGLNPGQFINKTDLSMWYIKEEVRDQKWNRLMELLKLEGLNVIEV